MFDNGMWYIWTGLALAILVAVYNVYQAGRKYNTERDPRRPYAYDNDKTFNHLVWGSALGVAMFFFWPFVILGYIVWYAGRIKTWWHSYD